MSYLFVGLKMSTSKCSYHPEIDAIDKCQKCSKAICLDCKETFVGHKYVRLEVCPVCYYDLKVASVTGSARTSGIIGIVFLSTVLFSILFFFIPLTLDFEGGEIFFFFSLLVSLFPAAMLVFLIRKVFFIDPITVEESLAKKADFLSNLGQSSSSKSSGFCSYCGEEIASGDRFCLVCGKERK